MKFKTTYPRALQPCLESVRQELARHIKTWHRRSQSNLGQDPEALMAWAIQDLTRLATEVERLALLESESVVLKAARQIHDIRLWNWESKRNKE